MDLEGSFFQYMGAGTMELLKASINGYSPIQQALKLNSNKDAPGKMEGFPNITLKDHFTRHVLARNDIFYEESV